MAHINLLPWREERRQERERNFRVIMLLTAIIAGAGVFSAHAYVNDRIDYQQDRNDRLQEEIARLDRQIEEIKELKETKERLIARMDVIQNLQKNRPNIVHLFDEMVRTVPEGIRLDNIKFDEPKLTFTGEGESAARVADYLRNLDASEVIDKPALVGEGIKARSAEQFTKLYGFTINGRATLFAEGDSEGGE